jgi:pilus assembly protein CpaF
VGIHKRLGCISPALAEKLLIGGVPQEEILRFTEGGAE